MKNLILASLTLLFAIPCLAFSPVGRWKTIDDETNKERSIVRIEEKNGVFEGSIEKIFLRADEQEAPKCTKCTDERKDQSVIGMKILWDLKHDEDGLYNGGKILDPKNGTTYKCKMTLSDDGQKLRVRGFIGFSLLGRSQEWLREPDEAAAPNIQTVPATTH